MVNINQIMKQAQEMQQKMQDMQAELAKLEYTGKSGGGMVFLTITGTNEMKSLKIDPSLIKLDEKEILEDLVIAAYNDARSKVDNASKDSMSGMMGGLGLPPGFKLPF